MKNIKNFIANNLIKLYIGFIILGIIAVFVTMIMCNTAKSTEHTEFVAVITHMDPINDCKKGEIYKIFFSTYSDRSNILVSGSVIVTEEQYARYQDKDVIMVDIITTTNYFNETDVEYQLIEE